MTDDSTNPETERRDRPLPAEDAVIVVRDATPVDAATEVRAVDPIDSSLVGEGGLPAAEARADDVLRLTPNDTFGGGEEATADEAPILTPADMPPPRDDWRASAPVIAPTPAPSRGGFWPLAFGGAVAAALGATAAWFAIPHLPEGWRPAAPVTTAEGLSPEAEAAARNAAVEAARAAVAEQTAGLSDQARQAGAEAGQKAAQDALAAAPAPQAAAAVDQAALDQQAQRIAALETALAQRPAAPAAPADPAQTGADTAAIRQQVEALAARPSLSAEEVAALQKLAAEADATRQAITQVAEQAQSKLASVQGEADALGTRVAETARRVDSAVAVAALEGALARGSDGSAGAQLKAAGVEPPAPLSAPIPPLTEVQKGFPDAARAGLKAALRESGGSTGGGLGAFLRAQTGARSVTPREGTDPDAILSRAGAAVTAGDIAAALALVRTLPAGAQKAMQGWTAQAEAWAAAQSALGALKTN